MLDRLLATVLLAGSACAQLTPPEFVDGDLADLTCTVRDVGDHTEFTAWLVIEVKNLGTAAAEPLAFRVELPPQKRGESARVETCERTLQPRTRRFGRPVPPGGTERYWIATSLVGKRRRYDVSVAQACWHHGDAVPEPELLAGEPKQVQMSSLTGTYPVTRVGLENPLDFDVDALFLVTLAQPIDVVELYGVRVPAHGKRDWNITARPGAYTFLDDDTPPGCAMKAVRFELVDWSLVAPPDPGAGAARLEPAYRPGSPGRSRSPRSPARSPTPSGSGDRTPTGSTSTSRVAASRCRAPARRRWSSSRRRTPMSRRG